LSQRSVAIAHEGDTARPSGAIRAKSGEGDEVPTGGIGGQSRRGGLKCGQREADHRQFELKDRFHGHFFHFYFQGSAVLFCSACSFYAVAGDVNMPRPG
jgi:hypothetical protein